MSLFDDNTSDKFLLLLMLSSYMVTRSSLGVMMSDGVMRFEPL